MKDFRKNILFLVPFSECFWIIFFFPIFTLDNWFKWTVIRLVEKNTRRICNDWKIKYFTKNLHSSLNVSHSYSNLSLQHRRPSPPFKLSLRSTPPPKHCSTRRHDTIKPSHVKNYCHSHLQRHQPHAVPTFKYFLNFRRIQKNSLCSLLFFSHSLQLNFF
jgi:hypothetical protein